ncbi:TetR family transcriptional regulator [Cellulomonas chitinilytica]|uniref:TetR family transcriptional regulator n=1 Tax=Cellulomonas chitinilytica TaxID=398759 RepID=A0A919TZX7_9CELL|nr:TetR family transcriptional regulator [Cellulomonas chitinilytica]GIG21323.1 TetR family transcriptional regulator [Cellulomonas chitinilytica]
MRSVDTDDLTTRARIRDAAIARFGRDGFRAGLRAVATDAGVSPALVIHHFGSKDGLRAECDAYVLRSIRDQKAEAMTRWSPLQVIGAIDDAEQYATVFGYVVRAILEGGAVAATFVEGMVADAESYLEEAVASGTVRPSVDPAGRARYLIATSVGMLLVAQLEAEAGRGVSPTVDPAGALREIWRTVLLPGLELMTFGLLTSSDLLDEYRAATDGHATAPP